MKTSQAGIDLIKQFEGCRLTAYKPVATEKYWTIGYGSYGPHVTEGMTITQARAEELLKQDLARFENAVNALGLSLNQNQFDALVSFAYNCGAGNLKKLCNGRTMAQIADAILKYDKAGGKVLTGLTRRRKAERELFLSGGASLGNPYAVPTVTLRRGSRGDGVKWLQWELRERGYDISVDGDFGPATQKAVLDYQGKRGLVQDSLVGSRTRAELLAGK